MLIRNFLKSTGSRIFPFSRGKFLQGIEFPLGIQCFRGQNGSAHVLLQKNASVARTHVRSKLTSCPWTRPNRACKLRADVRLGNCMWLCFPFFPLGMDRLVPNCSSLWSWCSRCLCLGCCQQWFVPSVKFLRTRSICCMVV